MLRPFDADDNVKKYRTFAESFRGLAKAARKARIICRSDDDNNVFVLFFFVSFVVAAAVVPVTDDIVVAVETNNENTHKSNNNHNNHNLNKFLGCDSIELNLVRSY